MRESISRPELRLQARGSPLDDVGAAVPERVHMLAAQTADLELELVGLAEALVEVELDPVGRDAPKRALAGVARGLEEGQRAVAAASPLRPYVEPAALRLDKLDRLDGGVHPHVPND